MADVARRNPLFIESPLGIIVLDRQGRVMDVNAAGSKALARPKERLVGPAFTEWVLPGDKARTEDAIGIVLAGQTTTWKARLRRGDGLPRIYEVKASPLSRGDAVEGVLIFLRDFSEKGEGRPEIRQLQTLMENLPGQFVVVTDKGGRIRYSCGLGRTHFLDQDSLLGKHYRELLGTERKGEENLEELLKSVGEGESWAGVQWHRRKDGVSFSSEVFASPQLDPKTGQVVGVMAIGRDLSSSRKWKELAEDVQPLATIGSLTGRISEEIGKGLARLEDGLIGIGNGNGNGNGTHTCSPMVKTEMRRLKRFLDGMAEFGGRGAPRPRSISLADLVHGALERVTGRMISLGIQPMVEVPPNLPAVFADERYLDRVLEIVLENALDAVDGCPIPLLRLELNNGPDGVILKILNSGSTVQKDWLDQIFDPFSTTREEGHSGLGLAIARGMTEAQGGRMWASIPQEGFLSLSIELPRESPDRVRRFRPAPLNFSRSRTVLVVDDDEAIRLALRSFLEKVGFDVREAWSGRSALAQLTAGRLPEIVLTDLKMSDGSGYWFLEEVEREFPKMVKRTIIITGDADHEAAHELSSRTGCPLVRKPFELPQLLEVLDQVCLNS